MLEEESLELSIIMPCRNEAAAVAFCVCEAKDFMEKQQIKGEVLVVDNVSGDASAMLAKQAGARVIAEKNVGYGNAVRAGIAASRGKNLIIGDCDATYDFGHLEEMYGLLDDGSCDMVIGNRYAGGMEKGSMPLSHRLGVRFLSRCAGIRFRIKIFDFHCGLRGMTRNAAEKLDFHTEGMEFATEMIAVAAEQGLFIRQLPVRLRCCTYARKSKLRTIRDGIRHLEYIFNR